MASRGDEEISSPWTRARLRTWRLLRPRAGRAARWVGSDQPCGQSVAAQHLQRTIYQRAGVGDERSTRGAQPSSLGAQEAAGHIAPAIAGRQPGKGPNFGARELRYVAHVFSSRRDIPRSSPRNGMAARNLLSSQVLQCPSRRSRQGFVEQARAPCPARYALTIFCISGFLSCEEDNESATQGKPAQGSAMARNMANVGLVHARLRNPRSAAVTANHRAGGPGR